MAATRVVNIKRHRCEVYIGRSGKGNDGYFGNPYRLMPGEAQGSTLIEYERYFRKRIESDPEFRERIHALKGKTLGCFCKPGPCHGDIIASYLDSLPE